MDRKVEANVKAEEDDLHVEKQHLINAMNLANNIFMNRPITPKLKNAQASINVRKQGNDLFSASQHNIDKHTRTWKLYTESVALAPNDSQELAFAYGNRSALLFHLKQYQECIIDCNKGFDLTNSDLLKAKLLLRKIECLVALKDESAKRSCKEVLTMFEKLTLEPDVRDQFLEKLKPIMNTNSKKEKKKVEKEEHEIPDFTRNPEVPCASDAISIKYNKKWGRHIVANRRIEPGEFLAIEKSYLTVSLLDGMYIFCTNCMKQTWASIPCDGCVFNIYCTEKCKEEAWEKYHQHECPVLAYMYNFKFDIYPYMDDCDEETVGYIAKHVIDSLRLLLMTVHEVGGINKLRQELMKIKNCEDPRTKGFSDDGIFKSDSCQSIYSLSHNIDCMNEEYLLNIYVMLVSMATYHLAKDSTFFGKKIEASPKDMMENEDIKFVGALLIRTVLIFKNNTLRYYVHRIRTILGQRYGVALYPFCSFFNHSCNPNTKSIPTKKNERIVYAKHLIEEGEQLYLCYIGENWTNTPKPERRRQLELLYHFKCKCRACKENWSDLPLAQQIIEKNPTIKFKLAHKQDTIEKLKNSVLTAMQREDFKFDSNILKKAKKIMLEFAENISARCMDYEMFEHCIYMMLVKEFGTWLNIPDTC